ncbi:MAG TPA: hypothetical protein HA252_06115, partial [Candidatus Diapherotrites archaeon]|nr:hypothetical protein [Candidatus Diapherotrites archaeon]
MAFGRRPPPTVPLRGHKHLFEPPHDSNARWVREVMAVERYHAPSVKKLLALNSRPRSVLAAAWFLPRHQLAALTNVLGVPRTQAILTDCFVPRNLPRTRANLAFLERVLDDLNPRDAEKFLATAGLRDAQVLT